MKSLKISSGSSLVKSRTKKSAQTLDTSISSYDRTDPFFAFNTLIKLLGSLPSRIGGCQFKLTPDEHKLSLHLLSIVEPFVGLAPSRRTITRQPTEVLDSIIFHVDSKRDLLSLALSCQRMYDVVFPRHFQYRTIRCKVSSISLWNHLIINRSLARNVRRLEILDERCTEPEILPPGILTTDTDLESTDDELGLHDKQERYLVAALAKMTALSTFIWSCNHSPISIDHVWPTLLKCYSLREVEINDNLVFSQQDVEENNKKARRPVVLPEMRMIALRSTPHIYGSTKHPNLNRISSILNHCPNLKSLDIAYNPPRTGANGSASRPPADELLLYSRWPQLTSLTLTNLRCSSTTGFDSASAFLSAHVNLEVLHLDVGIHANLGGTGTPTLTLPPNSLPRLRELQASKEVANAVLECPCDSLRPLETLKGFRLSGSQGGSRDPDAVFLNNLKRRGKTVKRVELSGWGEQEDIRRLIESSPGLTWLDIGRKVGMRSGSGAVVSNTVEWATLLSELPELTVFHGIKFFYEVSPQAAAPSATPMSTNISMTDRSRIRKNDEVASTLAWKCVKLRRLDHWEEVGGKVIVLVKDGEKVRWEARRVKL
ncbi:hypothetical protein BDZ94DRAFT_1177743 [Collybia nuda]|uniref:F-box domain-containing protein n=1 Tax=Collybia nuda TaxID=64659 RepID=A0A9P6CCU9_9AGAR|nr:hypothetical protein BDZ94DRAFT_1177743 [Collybia nuda]